MRVRNLTSFCGYPFDGNIEDNEEYSSCMYALEAKTIHRSETSVLKKQSRQE
jgi:hypothetical protein